MVDLVLGAGVTEAMSLAALAIKIALLSILSLPIRYITCNSRSQVPQMEKLATDWGWLCSKNDRHNGGRLRRGPEVNGEPKPILNDFYAEEAPRERIAGGMIVKITSKTSSLNLQGPGPG